MGLGPHCGVGWPGIPGSAHAPNFCCSCGKQLLVATDRSIADNQSKEKDSCESPALILLAKEATAGRNNSSKPKQTTKRTNEIPSSAKLPLAED